MTAAQPGQGPPIVEETLHILLVEDNPGDVRLTREAFRKTRAKVELHVVTDGTEAMAFLRKEGEHADAPRPDLILLDLNLPKMAGREVLNEVKADPDLKAIPTLVLTTVEDQEDIVGSYREQANAYLVKPVQLEAYEALVSSVNDFWVERARRPHEGAP